MGWRVRIRVEPELARRLARLRRAAAPAGALLTPTAVLAFALGCWRLAADMNLTGQFVISRGLFSHWQVWIGLAILLQACASRLNRYGRGGGEAMP